MTENFFGILKTECIYCQKLKTFQQANDLIDDYHHEQLQSLIILLLPLVDLFFCTVHTIWTGSSAPVPKEG